MNEASYGSARRQKEHGPLGTGTLTYSLEGTHAETEETSSPCSLELLPRKRICGRTSFQKDIRNHVSDMYQK